MKYNNNMKYNQIDIELNRHIGLWVVIITVNIINCPMDVEFALNKRLPM